MAAASIEALNSTPGAETFASFFDTNSVDLKAGDVDMKYHFIKTLWGFP